MGGGRWEVGAGEERTVACLGAARAAAEWQGLLWASDVKAVDALRNTEINAQLKSICRIYQRNNVVK